MPLYQRHVPQPIEVNGRGFTWTEFNDGSLEILSDDGKFSLRDCGTQISVQGEDFPGSTAEQPLEIQLHPGNLTVLSKWDVARFVIQQCLDGNYTPVGGTRVGKTTK